MFQRDLMQFLTIVMCKGRKKEKKEKEKTFITYLVEAKIRNSRKYCEFEDTTELK